MYFSCGWPRWVRRFRAHMAEYFDRMAAVADTMLAVFSVGLGLGRSYPDNVARHHLDAIT